MSVHPVQGDRAGMVSGHFRGTGAPAPGSRKQDRADPSLCRLGGSCKPPAPVRGLSRQIRCHPRAECRNLGTCPDLVHRKQVQVDDDEAGVHASQGSILITMQTEERARARAGCWGKVAREPLPPKGGNISVQCQRGGSVGSPREPSLWVALSPQG